MPPRRLRTRYRDPSSAGESLSRSRCWLCPSRRGPRAEWRRSSRPAAVTGSELHRTGSLGAGADDLLQRRARRPLTRCCAAGQPGPGLRRCGGRATLPPAGWPRPGPAWDRGVRRHGDNHRHRELIHDRRGGCRTQVEIQRCRRDAEAGAAVGISWRRSRCPASPRAGPANTDRLPLRGCALRSAATAIEEWMRGIVNHHRRIERHGSGGEAGIVRPEVVDWHAEARCPRHRGKTR